MSDLRKAAQELVNQWESNTAYPFGLLVDSLRAALAQPEPEPVAWMQTENFIDPAGLWDERKTLNFESDGTPLYATPPQRKPLTLQEVDAIWETKTDIESVVRAVEKAHGIE